jgi:hypothetical protein
LSLLRGVTGKDGSLDGGTIGLVDLGVSENLLNRFKSAAEEILAELFKTGTSEGGVEIDALEERVDLMDVW